MLPESDALKTKQDQSKPRSKWFWLILVCVILLVLFLSTMTGWVARSIYSHFFVTGGHVHVVNCTDQSLDVTIDFPSGRQHQFTLIAMGSYDFKEHATGEGNLTVSIPGRPPEAVGYVTSDNPMTILSIDDNNTTMSQVMP